MTIKPLVSIMMPAYNAEDTILRAVKSLQNQTYQNWECIIVDDGSTDNTSKKVSDIGEERIKLITLKKNMGRGYARQIALENCGGEYLAMLDADDWYYNYKLEYQVESFLLNPDLTIVSCGMAITDKSGNIVGVRAIGDNKVKKYTALASIPVPHAPSMYKASKAKKIKYDSRFKLAQDMDFMRRLLTNEKYLLLNSIGYVYEEANSKTPSKDIKSYYYNSLGYLKFTKQYPIKSSLKASFEVLKILRLLLYNSLGKYENLVASRSRKVSSSCRDEFDTQRNFFE